MKDVLEYLRRLPENTRELLLTIVFGLSAGCAAVLFQQAVGFVYTHTFVEFSKHSLTRFTLESLATVVITSLIVGFLLNRFSKDAAGSGVPQLKLAYWKDLGFVPFKSVLVKFIAGVLSLGGGTSLGREGPSVFIGGGIASKLSGYLGYAKRKRRSAAIAGAAAGLAAAFNTPLAAITFVVEEIIGSMNSRYLGRIVLSSVLGAFMVHAMVGRQPSFILPSIEWPSWRTYTLVPLVAVLAGITGALFQRYTMQQKQKIRTLKIVPGWMHPLVGGLVTWALGCLVFGTTGKLGVFSLGYEDLSNTLLYGTPWKIAGILLGAKFIATIFSYAWGGCGGIFSPTLFLGCMSGFLVSGIADIWLPLTQTDHVVLAVVGMSACFGASVRAPLTSILMLFEMTHQFSMVPALMAGALISQVVGRLLNRHNFYDTLIEQEGHNLVKIIPPRDLHAWQSMQIASVINPKPVIINDLSQDNIRIVLQKYSYKRFPVVINSELMGILTREGAENALKNNIPADIVRTPVCYADQSIKDVGNTFIQSPLGMLVVLNRQDNSIAGLLTLHDLLRAEAAMTENE